LISIVIPALNEKDGIEETISLISKVMIEAKLLPYEIVVIDDGSTDKTAVIAENNGAKVIRHPHNIGYGRAIKNGITAAIFETIIITDADNTYPFEEIPKMYEKYKQGFDMIVGSRTGPNYKESIFKMPLRCLLRFLVEWTSGRSIPDINSGLRIFNRSLSISFFSHLCDTFSFTTSLTLSFMMTGKFVAYHPINYYERTGKSHVRLFRDSLRTLQYIIEAIVFYNPLKFFSLVSLLCLGLSVLIFLFAYSLNFVTLFFLGVGTTVISILIFCIGLLAVQLKQILKK